MQVAVRVDASTEMGLGHLRRCLSLAQALRDAGAEVRFIARDLGVDVASVIAAAGFCCVLLRAPRAGECSEGLSRDRGAGACPPPSVGVGLVNSTSGGGQAPALRRIPDSAMALEIASAPPHARWAQVSWQTDAAETAHALAGVGVDWLVVDHYAFDERWHRALSPSNAARVAVIDDLADRSLAVDLVIDHNQASDHRAKYAGWLDPTVPLLGGPRFALLDAAYATAPRYAFHAEVRSIGVFMGGADAADLSSQVLRACREQIHFRGEVEFVTTRHNPHHDALQALASRWPDTKVTLDLPDLTAFLARHDLQVGAGGGATWERCCIGAPTLALVVADNQRHVLEPLAQLGVLHALLQGPYTPSSLGTEIERMIADRPLRALCAEQGRALVDGQGTRRVAYAMSVACRA